MFSSACSTVADFLFAGDSYYAAADSCRNRGGLLAGYAAKIDMVIMRIVDLFNALPDIVVILILSALLMSYGVGGR